MSNETTRRMIAAYIQEASPTRFLSGMFRSPPQNFHSAEEVEFDIQRGQEEVAIVIQDLSTGYRYNSTDVFTNKSFKPPIFQEAVPVNSFDLLKRTLGNDPFADVGFLSNLLTRIFGGFRKIENKILRTIELQASQILTTGILTLIDKNGVALYTLDFKPKASHFPTTGTAWDAGGNDPLGDIFALANVIRNDGLSDPNEILLGEGSFEAFIKNTDVLSRYNKDALFLAATTPLVTRGDGGQFRGTVEIGNYKYDLWTYGGRFTHPQTGVSTKYLPDNKVVVRDNRARLDATFGAIPNIAELLGEGSSRVLPQLPSRISAPGRAIDLHTHAWLSTDGTQLFAGAGSRPLLIPTAFDTFGCIDTLV